MASFSPVVPIVIPTASVLEDPLTVKGEQLVLLNGLKVSMGFRIREMVPRLLFDRSRALADWVSSVGYSFVTSHDVAYALLDEGLACRPEFKFPPGVVGNAALAYVGDAALSYAVARIAFVGGCTPHQYQERRKACSSKVALASFWQDRVLSRFPTALPVTWESVLREDASATAHQTSEFVEALIGALIYAGKPLVAEGLCLKICTYAASINGWSLVNCDHAPTYLTPTNIQVSQNGFEGKTPQ